MTCYRMEDGTLVDTAKAKNSWAEEEKWDGSNYISVATRSQWDHEHLYQSSKGNFYLVEWSNCGGGLRNAKWVSEQEATAWLLLNEWPLPDELEDFADGVCE